MDSLPEIYEKISNDPQNCWAKEQGWKPLYTAHPKAKIIIIGQAPGRLAQQSGVPWDDPSGRNLRNWMGISDDEFYDETKIALLPMDFYFPGSKKGGDIAPRVCQAKKWHPALLAHLKSAKLTLLVGSYSQNYYLDKDKKPTLTQTVRAYADYGPSTMPLVHPSPRNSLWQKKNPWFAKQVVPALRLRVKKVLYER